jgi:O-antigen ligase/tetratricopeptide (TPR) repeat protein
MSSRNGGTRRLLVWLAMSLAAFFILFAGGTYSGLYDQKVRIFTQILTIAVLAPWLVGTVLYPGWRPTQQVVVPVLIAFAGFSLATVLSVQPRLSAESFLMGAAVALAFLLMTRLAASPWFRPRLGVAVVAIAGAVSIGLSLEVGQLWLEWWGLVGRLTAPPLRPGGASLTLGGTGVVPAYLLLTVPLAAAVLWRTRPGRFFAVLLLGFALTAIVVTGSRGGLLGVAAGLLFLVGYIWRLRRSTEPPRAPSSPDQRDRPRRRQPWLIAGGAVGIMLAVALLLLPGLLVRLLDTVTVGERIDLWRAAINLFAANPLVGTGPGTWAVLKFGANPAGTMNLVVPHAHNLPLQVLAEIGLVGAIGLVPFGAWLIAALRRAMSDPDTQTRREAVAIGVSVSGFAALSLVDNLVNLPAVCLLLMTVVARVVPVSSTSTPAPARDPARSRSWQPVAVRAVAMVAAIAVSVSGAVQADRAALAADEGRAAVIGRDWRAAADAFRRAVEIDPDLGLYRLELGVALAWIGEREEAVEQLSRATAQDQFPMNSISLARQLLDSGVRDRAVALARLSLQADPTDENVAINAGWIGELAGDLDLAREAYARALLANYGLAGSSWWQSPPHEIAFADIVAWAIDINRQEGGRPFVTAELLARSGDLAAARAVVGDGPPSLERDVVSADILALSGDMPAARAAFEAVLARDPMSTLAVSRLAGIARSANDPAAAARYERWQEILGTPTVASAPHTGQAITTDQTMASPYPWNYPNAVYMRDKPIVFSPPGTLVVVPNSGPLP